jgi:hypothetical protein
MIAVWDIATFSLVEIYRRFRGTYFLHHQGNETARRNIQEGCHIQFYFDLRICAVLMPKWQCLSLFLLPYMSRHTRYYDYSAPVFSHLIGDNVEIRSLCGLIQKLRHEHA